MDQIAVPARAAGVFFLYRFVSRLYFYLPVLVVYFFSRESSLLAVGSLICCYSLAVLVCERPANHLVGLLPAKYLIILGELIKAAGLAMLVFNSQFAPLALAQVVIGLGYCLAMSGDAAIASRSFRDGEQHARVQKTAHVLVLLGVVAASIIGGVVAQMQGVAQALLISLPVPLLAALAAVLFVEPPRLDEATGTEPQVRGYAWLAASPGLLMSILNYGVSRAIFMSMFVAFIPISYLVLFKVPLSLFGLIIGGYTVISVLVAGNATVIAQRLGESATMGVSACSLVLAGLFLAWQGSMPWLLYLSPVLMGFAAGMTRPLAIARFSRLVGPEFRGRALTIAESLNAVITMLLILGICQVMDLRGIESGLRVLALTIACLACLTVACLYGENRLKVRRIII